MSSIPDLYANRKLWREVVSNIAEKASIKLPKCNGRIDKAVQIVLNNDVELVDNHLAKVHSQTSANITYTVNGTCECRDYTRAPSNWCKHRLAYGIYKRAMQYIERRASETSLNDTLKLYQEWWLH